MPRPRNGVALIGAALLMSACDVLAGAMTTDPVLTVGTTSPTKVDVAGLFKTFDLERDCMPAHQMEDRKCQGPTLLLIHKEPSTEQQAALRNQFQDYLLWRSEQVCERHKAGIIGIQSSTNFALNTLTTILTAAATVTTGGLTKSILAAAGGASNATRSHFNEDFYQRLVAPAVVRKINEMRTSELQQILAKRGQRFGTPEENAKDPTKKTADQTKSPGADVAPDKTTPISRYTVEAAVLDVERYHARCSFIAGLAELVEPTQKFADTAAGIRQRISDLRAEIEANKKLLAGADAEQKKRLDVTNQNLATQILVLSSGLATAPTTVNASDSKGGK